MKPIHLMRGLGLGALLSIALPACAKKTGGDAPPAMVEMPRRWSDLGMPRDGLKQLLPRTNEHEYYADYSGGDEAGLWAKVTAGLTAAGYTPACNLFDGRVRGFAKGDDKLAAKIDTFGGVLLALAIFDEQGKEALMHGACFGKYKLGPAQPAK